MLNLKTSAALFITLIVAVLAFIVSQQLLPSDASTLVLILPSLFSLLTVASLFVVSNMINTSPADPTIKNDKPASKNKAKGQISQKATNTADKQTRPSDGSIATLYVGNLAYKANEKLVQEHFEQVAKVKSVRLVKDKKTNRRKGFGFIEVEANEEALFISKMNDTEFMERNIIVRPANEKQH